MLENKKCPCGKEGRYIKIIDGEDLFSCNKYQRCPTYEELENSLDKQNKRVLAYQKFTNAIDDYFEYRCESKKDQRKVHQLLQNLTELLEKINNED